MQNSTTALLTTLDTHQLDPTMNRIDYEGHGTYRFSGNFLRISQAFNVRASEPALIKQLALAVFLNRARADYIADCEYRERSHTRLLDHLQQEGKSTVEEERRWQFLRAAKLFEIKGDLPLLPPLSSQDLRNMYAKRGSMPPRTVELLYALRDHEVTQLAQLTVIEQAHLKPLDHAARTKVADTLFHLCTEDTRAALRRDEHHWVRSAAALSHDAHEEAIALGFPSAQAAQEHQAWLAQHGTPEFKQWLEGLDQQDESPENVGQAPTNHKP